MIEENEKMMTVPTAKGCLSLVLSVVLAIPIGILNAYVLTNLWEWFIVPITTLPTLSIVQAFGLSWVISFFKIRINNKVQKYDMTKFSDMMTYTSSSALLSLFAWFGGWIITLFM